MLFRSDCADYLTKKGVPFRDAYKCTGGLVAECISKGLTLETLPLASYQNANPIFDEDIYQAISLETCVNGRTSEGGPSPKAVQKQIAQIRAFLDGASGENRVRRDCAWERFRLA